jgi:hypothetical protein
MIQIPEARDFLSLSFFFFVFGCMKTEVFTQEIILLLTGLKGLGEHAPTTEQRCENSVRTP